ncbi:hypothetical protein [Novosphingobium sp. AP12]|uniref:hypothetical protein n=1 Tax=Novosphingobium sp. AP12 TaxID=1144305 RepID=UPI000271D86F|nr:hypothetical protein [Novosphingobium sp. AP12]EJL33527.1 hypothetical protein PMI02_01070 [Novosphingobium sp. AP12]
MPQPALPSWINLNGAVGDLSAVLPELDAWAGLALHWREVGSALWKLGVEAPVDSPARLAGFLATHLADDAVIEVFATLGLTDLHGKLSAHVQKLQDTGWAKLLRPMSDFGPGSTGAPSGDGFGFDAPGDEGQFALSIPALAASASPTVGSVALTFDVGVQGGLDCEAGSPWPFSGDGVAGGLLRVGGRGKVTTSAGVSLPFGQIGQGTANAGASAEAAMSFFFRPDDPAEPFAKVLFQSVTAIPSPLDLDAISHAAALAGLEGIAFGCDGAVTAGLGLVLGKAVDIPKAVSGTIGVTANLAFRRNARWILSIRKTGEGMRFVLSRDELRERNWSAGIDLKLDAAPLTRRVHDLLTEAQNFAGPALNQIKPFLSPGTYIASKAASLLGITARSLVEQPQLREALLKDLALVLGTADASEETRTSALADFVAGRIADLAATRAEGILGDVDAWAATVVEGLASRIPGLSIVPQAELATRIRPLLSDIKGQFDGLVGGLAGDDQWSKLLAQELSSIGAQVQGTEAEANKLLGGVHEVFGKFYGFAAKVTEATKEGTSKKLEARFGWSGAAASGLKYELAGTFTAVNAETADLWHSLVTGQLEPFQKLLGDPSLAPPGVRLDPESSLSRFASKEHGFAVEVSVLGIDVSIASIVKGEATITTNAAGDIAVTAQGSALRKVEGFNEGRSATFMSSWDLLMMKADAAAGNRRSMTVDIGFDHNDDNLKAKEVQALLSGLADQRLIDQTRVTTALGIYQDWRVKAAPEGKVRGRIGLRLRLPDVAVQRMVAIGRELNRSDDPTLLGLFDLSVQTQIATGVTSRKQYERDIEETSDHRPAEDPVARIVAMWRSNKPLRSPGADGDRLSALAQLIPRSGALHTLLSTMAAIYDAVPASAGQPGGWTEAQYAEAEKRMVSASRSWLRLNQDFIVWFKSELHPAMLAFLRLMVAMNQQSVPCAPVVPGPGQDIDLQASNALFLISMSEGETGPGVPI